MVTNNGKFLLLVEETNELTRSGIFLLPFGRPGTQVTNEHFTFIIYPLWKRIVKRKNCCVVMVLDGSENCSVSETSAD